VLGADVIPQERIDGHVTPFAAPEASTAKHALSAEPALFEGPLFGDVVDFGEGT
jgi:hypothetical protein